MTRSVADIMGQLDALKTLLNDGLKQIELIEYEVKTNNNIKKPPTHFMGEHPADYGD